MRLLLPPLLISVDWFLKKCICVHSTADTALLFYTKWWNFAMLFRKNPKKSSEILQSVAKLVDFFYFLSDFQGIKMRNVSRETLRWNKKLFWCEMAEKTSRRQNKKFFDPTIFQKCWRGVGEQPTFAEQIKLHKKSQQKLKRESRCAPALPNRIQVVFLRVCFTWNMTRMILRKNNLQHPAKGGSTPAFACQYAAIAPLPCLNLQPWFSWFNFVWIGQLLKMQLQQESLVANTICFANVGYSPTPRQHF